MNYGARIFAALLLALMLGVVTTSATFAQDDEADGAVDVDVTVDEPDINLSDEAGTVEIGEPLSEDAGSDLAGVDLDEMMPIELWEALAGIFIPLVVGGIIRQGWTVQYKNIALFCVSLVVTAIGLYFQGDLDRVEDWVTTVMTLLLMAYASYNTLGQAFPVAQWIESKTGGDPMNVAKYQLKRAP
jgi:hypothetical protein